MSNINYRSFNTHHLSFVGSELNYFCSKSIFMRTLSLLIAMFLISNILIAQHQHKPGNGYADSVNQGLIPKDTMKSSPKRVAMATIGNTHIHIEYGSPGVKGRMIWGGLVAYNEVWATGAHNATTIEFSTDVTIAGKKVRKGKYAFFTIPGKTEWTILLNTRHQQHLADEYNSAEDVIRLKVKPTRNSKMVQRLTFTIKTKGNNASINMEWEHIGIALNIIPT